MKKLLFAVAAVCGALGFARAESGTEEDPYQISSEADLAKITQYGMGEAGKGKCFELTADIALTKPWAGIGTYNSATDCFSGVFDGKGHKICNVVMADNGSDKNNYRGFFNQIDGGTVRNLTVATTGFGTADLPSGEYGCAAIAGAAYNATLENCVAEGVISSGTHNVGGIVIRIKDTSIIGCTNRVDVTGNYTKVAGVCVLNQNSTTGCLIEGCVNEGTVTAANGTNAGRDGIAGIIAYVGDGLLTIRDCENKGAVAKGANASSAAKVGQIIGYNYKGVKAFEGTIKGTTGVRMIGDVNGKTIDRHLATVSGSVATFVADSAIQSGKSYASMATGTVMMPSIGLAVTIDDSLAPITVATSAGNAKVVKDGNRYYSVASVGGELDITDAVRLAGKGSKPNLTKGKEAAASYSADNAFSKTDTSATRVLLKDEENDIEWTIADDFCPGQEIVVTSYTIRRTYFSSGSTSDDSISRQRAPISFALEGSEDGTTWKTIDAHSGISWETDKSAKEMTFAVVAANLGSYRAYRFRTFKTTRNETTSKCGFQYVALKGVIGSAPRRYLDKAIGGYGFATRLDDFMLSSDSKIELDVVFTSLSGTQGLFSNCFSDDSKKFRLFHMADKGWRFDYGSQSFYNATKASLGVRYKIVVDGPVVTLNGDGILNAGDKQTNAATCGLALFATSGGKTDSSNVYNGASVVIYGVKVWDAAGNLTCDLRPGVRQDGTRALLADPYGIRGYVGLTKESTYKQLRTDFRVHKSETDIVAKMREAKFEPVATPGEGVELADVAGNNITNFFSNGLATSDRLLLKNPAATINFDLPAGFESGKSIVLTRFVIVPCAAKKDDDGLGVAAQRGPAQFELQASANGTTWKSLYRQEEKLSANAYLQGGEISLGNSVFGHEGLSFEIPESVRGNYRHYRLITTATNRDSTDTAARWGVQSVKLFGLVGGFDPGVEPVEYVQNANDSQNSDITYFNTDYQPAKADLTIELKGEFTRVDQTMGLFCCRGEANKQWICWLNNKKLRVDYGSSSSESSFAPTSNVPYTITVKGRDLYVNGNYVYSASGSTDFKPGSKIVLLASHTNFGGWGNQACFKLKSCKITDASGGVVRDYVPVKNLETGKGALYDKVTETVLAAGGSNEISKTPRMGAEFDADFHDFRQRGRAVTLATEPVDGQLPEGPLTFAFEGNEILQGTLCAAFGGKSIGTDRAQWKKVVELGTVNNGEKTMTVELPEDAAHYRRVKFFIRDDLNDNISHTRMYGTGIRGTTIIIR